MMTSEISKYQRFRDPFAEDPVPKAFYHPTKQKDLSQTQKRTALSPVRGPNKGDNNGAKLTVPDKQFLKGANTLSSKEPPRLEQDEQSSKFDESWPSSEHQSTVSMFGLDENEPLTSDLTKKHSSYIDRFADLKRTLQYSENDSTLVSGKDKQRPSRGSAQHTPTVLSKYIERFRQGDPMSREERQKTSNPGDFWWLNQDAKESASVESTPRDNYKQKTNVQSLTKETLASFSQPQQKNYKYHPHRLRKRTRKLQEKADRFLEKSVSSLATTDHDFEVSTDGLGSSLGETTQTSIEEQPYRPKFVKDLNKENVPQFNLGVPMSAVTKPTCPEEDILYQWRIKRKMEQARERTLNIKESFPPSSFVPKSQTMSDVEKKLEEFKQRLSEGKLGAPVNSLQMANGIISFTPAPNLPVSERRTEDKHTPRTPVKNTEKEFVKDDTYQSKRYPTIASPTLKRRGTRDESVEPHLHLMCDLLPCPHQSEFSKQYGHESVSDGQSVKESESETYKYLEAERPDVEKSISDHDQSGDSDHTGVSSGARGQVTEVKRRINYDDDCVRSKKLVHDSELKDLRPGEGEKSGNDNVPKKSITPREEGSRKHKENLISDIDKQSYQQNNETRVERKDGRERKNARMERERREVETKETVPTLLQSKSPRPRQGRQKKHVESTIGQVIKDRLFDLSTSSVISSVDSLPTFVSQSASFDHTLSESQPQPPQDRIPTSQGSAPPESAQPCPQIRQNEEEDSDGEFPDDQLLVMLRRQRAQYEEQLRVIDEKLATIVRHEEDDR
ncbi:titin homolog [Argopecten irradians]|uniref:titin homolog n=1 Tax=Argopecten irradians TaxID=31199 RepID=UPI0037242541